MSPTDRAGRIVVVAAVVERDDRFLVTRRQAGAHLGGFWEFPGGKCEAAETDAACLEREMKEELGVGIRLAERVLTTVHPYADRTIELRFYRCGLAGDPQPLLGQEMRWVRRAELRTLEFPPADAELIRVLTDRAG